MSLINGRQSDSKITFSNFELDISLQASLIAIASAAIGSKQWCLFEKAKTMEPLEFLMRLAVQAIPSLNRASMLIFGQSLGGLIQIWLQIDLVKSLLCL